MTTINHQHFDFIIIGGGPAGSSCAIILRRAGLNVLVCDKEVFPREKICGDCVNPKNWCLFEQIGVAEKLKAHNLNKIDKMRIVNSHGREIVSLLPNDSGHPFFALKRSVLDTLLLDKAREEGAIIKEGMQAVDARWAGKWQVEARETGSADRIAFSSDFLIGADGRNSLVATKLLQKKITPVKKCSRKSPDANRVGVQWHTSYQPQVGTAVEMYLFGLGYGGIVNVDEKNANVAMVIPAWQAPLAKKKFSEFLALSLYKNPKAANRFGDLTPTEEIRFTHPIDPKSNRAWHPNAILIGDAHQTVEPFTGEGIYYALQDGIRAGTWMAKKYCADSMSLGRSYGHRFWANRIYSPALKSAVAADRLVSLGSRSPLLISLLLKTVFNTPTAKEQTRHGLLF